MFKVNDIVTVLVENPSGVDRKTKGTVGIVTEIYRAIRNGKEEIDFCVKESKWGYEFYYAANELRLATETEIREKVKQLIGESED